MVEKILSKPNRYMPIEIEEDLTILLEREKNKQKNLRK